jgi:threonyl-tRNA synthetase
VRVLPVVDDVADHAADVRRAMVRAGIRAVLDDRSETLASRVRDAQQAKVPYVAVIGRREAADGTVAVRLRDGSQLPAMEVGAVIELIAGVVQARRVALVP